MSFSLNSKSNPKTRTGKGPAKAKFKFKSKVYVWSSGYRDGDDSGYWRFARVPEKISAKIKEMQKGRLRRGWGAIYAKAKVKKSEWVTSIFPDRHSATYILPLKKKIRYQENLYDGAEFTFTIFIWF
jgi:hypothetical protein